METPSFHRWILPGLLTLISLPSQAQESPAFVDVSAEAGVTHTYASDLLLWGGSGVAVIDFDGDGELDLIFPGGDEDPIQLFRGLGDWQWEDLTAAAALPNVGTGKAAIVADYDNDGDPDVLITSYDHPPSLLQNQGGLFTDVASAAGITGPGTKATDAAWADVNEDGWLDLFIVRYTLLESEGNRLYLSNGDGTFTDQTAAFGLIETPVINIVGLPALSASLDVQAFDADNDGDLDFMIANDRGYGSNPPSRFWVNDGEGHFMEMGQALGLDIHANAMGLGILDLNRDGFFDIFLTNTIQGHFQMVHGCDGYHDQASAAGTVVARSGWGVVPEDLNLDGWPDLYVAHDVATAAGEHRNSVFINAGDGSFVDVGDLGAPPARQSTGVAAGDFDGDGDPDLVVVNIDEPAQVLRNDLGDGHWLQIALEGVQSNRDGIGARVEIDIPGATIHRQLASSSSYLSSNQLRIFAGLGDAELADRVTIHWPSGTVQTLFAVSADQVIHVIEEEMGPDFPLAGERCGDGIDNDCDGVIDPPEIGSECVLADLDCPLAGVWDCSPSSFLPACTPTIAPEQAPEICGDGFDNNCDGSTDEGFEALGEPCLMSAAHCEVETSWICTPDGLALACAWLTSTGLPPLERCDDDVDNDCDGDTDEGFEAMGAPCFAPAGIGQAPVSGFLDCDPTSGSLTCEESVNWRTDPPSEPAIVSTRPEPTSDTRAGPPHAAFAHIHAGPDRSMTTGCRSDSGGPPGASPIAWFWLLIALCSTRKVDLTTPPP